MKLYTETYESPDKIKSLVEKLFNTKVETLVTRYVKDEITQQTHQSIMIYIDDEYEKYSSILFDIEHNKIYDGVRFYLPPHQMIPPLYIPSIHVLTDIPGLFKSLLGYDYVKKFIKLEKKMDEDGNVPTLVFFKQTLPRTDTLKDFYMKMYSSPHGYQMEYNRYGENIVTIRELRSHMTPAYKNSI
jgi:hypothetical protein